ncbi:hypothetical protein BJ165DRAFT_1540616 [Panaeolus papilionaceus]|nr:hypothetical protein BJ165DRAFT_1540616 [Panaeolus papilionaceus]
MIIILDIILFLRVYALYQKNFLILLLVPAILSPYACGVYTSWNVVLRRRESFNGLCDVTTFHDLRYARIALGVTLILSHAAIWLCGYLKRNTGQGRIPVVRLVVHECSWIFALLVACVAVILPAGISSGVINPYYHFFLPTTLLSAVNCRIIQNMHNLALNAQNQHHPREANDEAFRLTTFIHTDVETEDETRDSDCRTLHFN